MPEHPLRLSDQLCFAVYSAGNAITRSYRPRLQRLGLTYPQYLLMMALWEHGSHTVGQLANRLGLASHAVTPLLDRLSCAGHVVRLIDGVDRRVVHVHLTEQGKALQSAAADVQHAVVCDTGLDEQSLTALREELNLVTSRLASSENAPTAQPKKTSASA